MRKEEEKADRITAIVMLVILIVVVLLSKQVKEEGEVRGSETIIRACECNRQNICKCKRGGKMKKVRKKENEEEEE